MGVRGPGWVALAAPLLLAALPARADPAYRTCTDRTSTNAGFAECGAAYLKRADEALNEAWKEVFGAVDGQTKTDLLAEQRAWNVFKEASCAFYRNGQWGREGEVLGFFGCRGEVIERRTAELKAYAAFLKPEDAPPH